MDKSSTPTFDAAAEAASFCRRAAALSRYRRWERAADGDEEAAPYSMPYTLGAERQRAFEAYLAAGGSLAELYGLEPAS